MDQRLNDPSLAPPPSVDSLSTAKKDKKKRKSSDSALPITGRTGSGSFEANTNEITFTGTPASVGSRKKMKREEPNMEMVNGFAKPRGFEAARKGKGKAQGKDKKPFDEHVWGEQGTTRAWDVGKEGEDSESESESESDDEDREVFGQAVDELFKNAGSLAEEDDETMMDEMRWDEGEGTSKEAQQKKKTRRKEKK